MMSKLKNDVINFIELTMSNNQQNIFKNKSKFTQLLSFMSHLRE